MALLLTGEGRYQLVPQLLNATELLSLSCKLKLKFKKSMINCVVWSISLYASEVLKHGHGHRQVELRSRPEAF